MTVYAVHSGEQLVRLVLRVRARDRGELRADIDAGLMADPFSAPLWFRLLVTKASCSWTTACQRANLQGC